MIYYIYSMSNIITSLFIIDGSYLGTNENEIGQNIQMKKIFFKKKIILENTKELIEQQRGRTTLSLSSHAPIL